MRFYCIALFPPRHFLRREGDCCRIGSHDLMLLLERQDHGGGEHDEKINLCYETIIKLSLNGCQHQGPS